MDNLGLSDIIKRAEKEDKDAYAIEKSSSLEKEKIEDMKQDRSERKKYAESTFTFVSIFTFFVLMILGSSGMKNDFHLSDNVLMTLITTSLGTIIGIFLIVMKYLFPK